MCHFAVHGTEELKYLLAQKKGVFSVQLGAGKGKTVTDLWTTS